MIGGKVIDKHSTIEEITNLNPETVTYLMDKGIRCYICGEPIWGTLEEVAKSKGFNDKEIKIFVRDINKMMKN